MNNKYYFRLPITQEQIDYAQQLVDYSLANHRVHNIWDTDLERTQKTKQYRFTGSLGEVLFADIYQLPRPTRAFGAVDGQDNGVDFLLVHKDKQYKVDVKTQWRKTKILKSNYVLNIPDSQLNKSTSQTDYYFCISIDQVQTHLFASFLGFISKRQLLNYEVGLKLWKGTARRRDDGTFFYFKEDTFEVLFADIYPPLLNEQIRSREGFEQITLSTFL